jgi:uncharacterized protein (UPF0332 family)
MNLQAVDDALEAAHALSALRTEASCRRSISTAYYAMFWELTYVGVTLIVGDDFPHTELSFISRGISHKDIIAAANYISKTKEIFPQEMHEFSKDFIALSEHRNKADYDILYTKAQDHSASFVSTAREAVKKWRLQSEANRRAFMLLVVRKDLVKKKNDK